MWTVYYNGNVSVKGNANMKVNILRLLINVAVNLLKNPKQKVKDVVIEETQKLIEGGK